MHGNERKVVLAKRCCRMVASAPSSTIHHAKAESGNLRVRTLETTVCVGRGAGC